jgi:hypothetical protein
MTQFVECSDEPEAASSGHLEAPIRRRRMGANATSRNNGRVVRMGAMLSRTAGTVSASYAPKESQVKCT